MSPQVNIPLAANILGGLLLLIPQIWYNFRRKNTDGLPGPMVLLWAICAVPFGVYSIVQNFNIPIQIQPQCLCALSLVTYAQILIYHNRWSPWKASVFAVAIGISFAGIEALLILTLRIPYSHGVSWPITLIGILAAVLLAAGLIPPYFELAKRNGRVIGINFIFLTVDFSGAFFSTLALAVQHTFDILGGILYIVCMLLEIGIFLSHGIWLIRTRKLRHEAKLSGKSIDEILDERQHGNEPKIYEQSSAQSTDLELGNKGDQKHIASEKSEH
ncbi:hypothetical protein L228DRAFT_268333 [Xylona heveae TC161]|uniref:PQ loop repeat protein n=1 Tax=Xylona heveae (strain CBS 132557 / TC161) TaxID=1328760 RepID=A0A161TBC3_XYLHT|nr:hypothetical protein L228DRAFT_268333 [Xylona heveae TC161]KZF22967.1 hypothetical protein L228DRAFT_268333 [Xylona heveae TC161]